MADKTFSSGTSPDAQAYADNAGGASTQNYFEVTDPTKDDLLSQEKYDFSYRSFPSDIGSEGTHHQHYMVININVRDSVAGGFGGSAFSGFIKKNGQEIKTFTVIPEEMSKTDVLRFNIDRQYKSAKDEPLGIYDNDGSLGFVLPRFTRRIVESIAIFMPQSVQYTNQHEYTNLDLMTLSTEIVGSGVSAAMKGKRGYDRKPGGGDLGLLPAILERGSQFSALAQVPLNPLTEVLYRTTPQRQFLFDFLLAPSNRAESVALDQIYKTLRFHAAPELTTNYIMPLYKSPSEFDITFFHRGKENTAIPRINTCVLERIDMDYSPTGIYATFSNGAPVIARMTLQFRELEIVTKLRVVQNF